LNVVVVVVVICEYKMYASCLVTDVVGCVNKVEVVIVVKKFEFVGNE
jgi:hypothetical protein